MLYDTREDFFLQLFVDYALINEVLVGPFAEVCLKKLGIKHGLGLEERFRKKLRLGTKELTADEFARFMIQMLNSLGGQYTLKRQSEDRFDLASEKCIFGYLILKSPALCQVLQGIIGGVAARNFSYCKIHMQRLQANNDCNCLLSVYFRQTAEAENKEGKIFLSGQNNYVVTPSEVMAVKEELDHKEYDTCLQGFEDLKLIYRDMKTEYNHLRDEIFSDLRLGVFSVNKVNEITYLNKTAQEIFRADRAWGSPAGKAFQEVLEETVKAKKKRFNQHLLQVPIADGLCYYSVNASPLFDEAGNVNGAVCVFQDVTETKRLENELLQMEKFSLVAELAAGTAHEIRNPMTTLRGFLQILSQEFSPGTKGYEYCVLMIDEIDRANAIIKEFLLLTKPAAPHLTETDLHLVLDEIFLLIESKTLLENVELKKEYIKKLPVVKADPAQIKQVFLNLATNAIQAMPSGGQLTIATQVKAGKAVVHFQDTGCGMDERRINKIFHPFFTTKENGTGLGLTISYRIIESHGGKIFVESTPNKGTIFTIELPAIHNA